MANNIVVADKLESFETFTFLKSICIKVIKNPQDVTAIGELKQVIDNSPHTFIKVVHSTILATFYPILKSVSENKTRYSPRDKEVIVQTLTSLFEKCKIDNLNVFFNIYAFLLFEIYDAKEHKVLDLDEQYKLYIMQCIVAIMKSITTDVVTALYVNENVSRLCQILYVAVEFAKKEKLRNLRIAAIECIMSIARVLEDEDFSDVVTRYQVAETFYFFLPGVASTLKQIALEDEKVGHKVQTIALKAWGRIVVLLMQDYNASDNKIDLTKIQPAVDSEKEIIGRSPNWYKDTDEKLHTFFIQFSKLTYHSHINVRKELASISQLIIENCITTMPTSISYLIEIIIVLSEDSCEDVALISRKILTDLSEKLSSDKLRLLLENLEDGFYNGINRLPRKFNGIDEEEQIASLNLLIGYISLFGQYNLEEVLLSSTYLNHFMSTLIHISELEKKEVSVLVEYTTQELEAEPGLRTPWKKFQHFSNADIQNRLEHLCAMLGKFGSFRMISDFLLDVIDGNAAHRKEAIFILNSTISGVESNEENSNIINSILQTYIDDSNWNLQLSTEIDKFGYEYSLTEVQNNIIQKCLLLEGIGKIALTLKEKFQQHLLKVLYLVLEGAGNVHPLIRTAGISSLINIATSCNYSTIPKFINANIDYFTFHIERKLNRIEDNPTVLNVLAVTLKYSQIDVLDQITDIINEVLMYSCDKFKERNATDFLNIFKIFIKCLMRWLDIKVEILPIKSKEEKQMMELEHFQVSNEIDYSNDFSDKIMGEKTAEEMYNEDLEKKQQETEEVEEVQEYKKPEPPLHIKLTVQILSRSLHFLPSKDRNRKLLVLEILTDGLEIIRDFEDELLPIVHQIWSPLAERFKEHKEPLIINYSFKLLNVLARLSKDFIRMRTTKEVLPQILIVLDNLYKCSYLKDVGSAYRYSQAYKLQVAILENLAIILTDLDVIEKHLNEACIRVFKYLSNKQPILLQTSSLNFFKIIHIYDRTFFEQFTNNLVEEFQKNEEYARGLTELRQMCEVVKEE